MEEKKFLEHLEELRGCIIRCLIGLAAGAVVSFLFISSIFRFLSMPYAAYLSSIGMPVSNALRSLSPGDTFQISLRSAILFGAAISLPWTAYQIWRFVAPGLYRHEKRHVGAFCLSVIIFFIAGASFAYFVTLPAALSFFYNYTVSMGVLPDWAISNYFNFVLTFLACFGVVFELPVAIIVLTWLGLATPASLAKYRRHAVIIIFIAAAVFTPPDIISQLMMGLPMIVLYELSIQASRLFERKSAIKRTAC